MNEDYMKYDGRKPEPPYKTPEDEVEKHTIENLLAEIARMKPVVERLIYAESYLESALEDADQGVKGVSHVVGLLKDIKETITEYEQSITAKGGCYGNSRGTNTRTVG